MAVQRMTGRDAFLAVLADEGVTHLFGNPGTTELPVMEALAHFPQIRYVLGLQESLVVAMADGFSRASGQLSAVNLHCMPGLGHAMGAIYAAKFSGSPMIITAGQYEIGHGLQEPLLYEPLVPIAQPLVKWSFEIHRIQDIARVLRRAAKIATTPPCGPVFLSLPGSVLDEEAEIDLMASTRVRAEVAPVGRSLLELVDVLARAERPVILAGRELAEQDAFGPACELASMLGAAVYLESVPYNSRFPVEHVCHMGDITRNQKKVRETLAAYDVLICLGGDLLRMSAYSAVDPLPEGIKLVHISERDWELGKNYHTALAIRAHVKSSLEQIIAALALRLSDAQRKAASLRLSAFERVNWQARRADAAAAIESFLAEASQGQHQPADVNKEPKVQPESAALIDPKVMMYVLSETVPDDALVVEEAPTTAAFLHQFLKVRRPLQAFGLSSGGLGFGLPGAIGMALANPGRRVVALIGDGSAMYAIQGLWTAAHLRLAVSFVIANNRSYRIIKDRLIAMRDSDHFIGMDFKDPAFDFSAIAAGMGVEAICIREAGDLASEFSRAFGKPGPNLIDVHISSGYE
ncbi:MAG: thiamine pyrophosphate-binding protein [Betaproteobacteria bacterium]|nr:thiamine pyrophosphate-binding protein [Pseudomonadota bacterium]NBT65567.1 thiamine pyrophosphate-binding protein [Betaproteobacteria bacterium]NCV32188.1 thiamine pyrophosphate-binding protein [Betaproteobacteria bacterium]NDA21366.1 thiamine pyrophosphate-binding protein [Betaproteobacteria bacterium]NDA31702.1 thiamine pyrophosphate-binding protein [Betaproteobacteria bacterium]